MSARLVGMQVTVTTDESYDLVEYEIAPLFTDIGVREYVDSGEAVAVLPGTENLTDVSDAWTAFLAL